MSLPRMSLHIGDYKKDTGHLGAAEHGAYLLLTMHYWATGGLPNDDVQLARIACMGDKAWKAARPTIAAFFKPSWKHKRIEEELAAARERSASASTSASHRWSKRNANAYANASETHSDGIATEPHPIGNALPSPKEEERKISPSARAVGSPTRTGLKARIEELFEELWAKKPKRDGANPKMPALKKFLRIVPFGEVQGEAKAREIINACQRWAEAERKSEREGKETVAQLITWLNQSRWGDYPAPAAEAEPNGFYAVFGSPELDAWDAYRMDFEGRKYPRDKRGGWSFPTQWPAGYEVKNANGHGARDGAEGRAEKGAAGISGRESPRQSATSSEGAECPPAAPPRPPGSFAIE